MISATTPGYIGPALSSSPDWTGQVTGLPGRQSPIPGGIRQQRGVETIERRAISIGIFFFFLEFFCRDLMFLIAMIGLIGDFMVGP